MQRMRTQPDRASPPSGRSVERLQQRQRRRELRARSFERSPLFESEIFQKEMKDLFQEFMRLGSIIGKFGDFDTDGRKIFVERAEGTLERLKVHMARVQLAKDDPMGQWLLRVQAVQMLEANTNMDMVLQGLEAMLADMCSLIAHEEATCDPAVLAAIKRGWTEQFRTVRSWNVDAMTHDPLVALGAADPQALKAARELADNPMAAEKYRDNAPLYAY